MIYSNTARHIVRRVVLAAAQFRAPPSQQQLLKPIFHIEMYQNATL